MGDSLKGIVERKISRRCLLGFLTAAVGLGALALKFVEDALYPYLPTLSAMPTPVSRTEWGARLPDHDAPNERGFAASPLQGAWYVYPGDLAEVYNTVVIHHSAIALDTNETMRSVQDLHMNVNRWADIGYHYGIDRNGVIYEGRDIRVRGASVARHNTGVIGVVVMGNFEIDTPLDVQLTALQTLVNWLAATYALTHLAGHSEFNPESLCPGKNLSVYLDRLARGAGLARGTAGYIAPTG
jgi:hypothetical protein